MACEGVGWAALRCHDSATLIQPALMGIRVLIEGQRAGKSCSLKCMSPTECPEVLLYSENLTSVFTNVPFIFYPHENE